MSMGEDRRVCRDPNCSAVGQPQPIESFQPHPRATGGRMTVCRECFRRKQRAATKEGPLGRAPKRPSLPVPREVSAPVPTPATTPTPLRIALDALAQIAAGRLDGRRDQPPYLGPRSHREIAAEALESARAALAGEVGR